jgi:hypothetical protein
VVDTEAVAVERVRLGKETVTDQETVGARSARKRSNSTTATPDATTPPVAADLPGRR